MDTILKKSNRMAALAILALVAALAIAGCGSGDETTNAGTGADTTAGDITAAPNPEEGATFVSVASVDGLGQILVDSSGHTVYKFDKDQGAASACYGACATSWPPVTTEGEAHASNGAQAGMIGTTKRKDGTEQVTYDGHPLYTFVGDKGPGEANGNAVDAFGAEWYALTPSGAEPDGDNEEVPPPPTSY